MVSIQGDKALGRALKNDVLIGGGARHADTGPAPWGGVLAPGILGGLAPFDHVGLIGEVDPPDVRFSH